MSKVCLEFENGKKINLVMTKKLNATRQDILNKLTTGSADHKPSDNTITVVGGEAFILHAGNWYRLKNNGGKVSELIDAIGSCYSLGALTSGALRGALR